MDNQKYTDEQIIEALEQCEKDNFDECKKRPLRPECDKGNYTLMYTEPLNLIRKYRKQSEDKELRHKYELAVAEREANIKGFTEALEKAKIDAVIKFSWKLEQLLCHTYRSEFSLDNEEAENKVKKAIAYLEERITNESDDVVKSE